MQKEETSFILSLEIDTWWYDKTIHNCDEGGEQVSALRIRVIDV